MHISQNSQVKLDYVIQTNKMHLSKLIFWFV